ncbi:ACT domain-containing protein [Candidatus Gracilibacteria bacterium]|nr:ACT domain-containing protein [Candidatus Gracilibacteria bacterium]
MTKTHSFKVTLRVNNEVGVLARITTRLRKYRVNIASLEVAPIDESEKFSDIHMVLETDRDNIDVPMAKTRELIPVISIEYHKI